VGPDVRLDTQQPTLGPVVPDGVGAGGVATGAGGDVTPVDALQLTDVVEDRTVECREGLGAARALIHVLAQDAASIVGRR
jgi:hypothetical protein